MSSSSSETSSITLRIPAELVRWLDEEADRRVVGRRLLVVSALRLLREAIERAPDLVDLPPVPRAREPRP